MKYFKFSLLAIALFITALLSAQTDTLYSNNLNVVIGDVGQADAIFIRCPHGNHEILIDAGGINLQYPKSKEMFTSMITKYQGKDNPLEIVVASHPHADHIGNMLYVLDNYRVDNYVDNGFKYHSATYKKIMDSLKVKSNITYHSSKDKEPTIEFCSLVDIEFIRPKGFENEAEDPNDRSVILKLTYKDDTFLFVGDCEGEQEHLILEDDKAKKRIENIDFLKVGHHGSHSSTTVEFLEVTKPKIAAISAGETGVGSNKKYKHPRADVIKRLLDYCEDREGNIITITEYNSENKKWEDVKVDKAVYTTKYQGDIVFISDGKGIMRIVD